MTDAEFVKRLPWFIAMAKLRLVHTPPQWAIGDHEPLSGPALRMWWNEPRNRHPEHWRALSDSFSLK